MNPCTLPSTQYDIKLQVFIAVTVGKDLLCCHCSELPVEAVQPINIRVFPAEKTGTSEFHTSTALLNVTIEYQKYSFK